jgi:hypothetical protein
MRLHLLSGCMLAAALFSGVSATRIASAATPAAHSAILVELFTSEGCSSCPPADDLLRQINGKNTAAGQLIVGISEHVTYWNRLGWADPYSSSVYTERQSAYGSRFGLDSVYTPQMVIDGQEQIVGSDAAALMHALAAESGEKQIDLRIVSDEISGGALTVRFTAQGTSAGHALDVIAVVTDDKDRSNVLRGENAGRALQHVAVARVLMQLATIHGDGEQTVRIALPPQALAETGAGHHLILFAQRGQAGPVMGIDTKPL